MQKDVKIFEKNWPTLICMAPKLKCANPPFDKEKKMCQISLNTYSHNEPYDLHAQVIFQKKSLWWQHTSNHTYTFLDVKHYYYDLKPSLLNITAKNVRLVSAKSNLISILQYLKLKTILFRFHVKIECITLQTLMGFHRENKEVMLQSVHSLSYCCSRNLCLCQDIWVDPTKVSSAMMVWWVRHFSITTIIRLKSKYFC